MTELQRDISNKEKKYMNMLSALFFSEEFKAGLINLKNVVNKDYNFIRDNYDKKNKVDIAIERLIRYFVYKKSNINIVGIYPSPISCDMAIETDDCILNIDSKTIDSVGNLTDIKYFHFESNQSSFQHANYGAQNGFIGLPVKTNLPPIDPYTNKPILTYFLKIIYSDNGREFSYYQDGNNMSLTCLPNGVLSNLFPSDMIFNFKTYIYSDERFRICSKETAIQHKYNFSVGYTLNNVETFIDELANVGFHIPLPPPLTLSVLNGKPLLISQGKAYVPVSRKDGWYLEEIISGHTARILYSNLLNRVDGNNLTWLGHLENKVI